MCGHKATSCDRTHTHTIMNRYYSFEVIIYDLPTNIYNYINSVKSLRHFLISPYHDRDVDKDGKLLKPHTHVYCTCVQNLSFKGICNRFNDVSYTMITEQNITNIKTSCSNCYEYAYHKDNNDKVLYSEDDIICDDINFWRVGRCDENKAYLLVIDMLEKKLSTLELVRKYGREYVVNRSHYEDVVYNIRIELQDKNLADEFFNAL